jgi:hypothetical protein
MMKANIVSLCLVLWAVPLMAETYSWIDDSGTFNFTEEYSSVPKKYRAKVAKRGDMGNSAPAQQAPAYAASEKKSSGDVKPAAQSEAAESSSGGKLYGGRKIEEWKRDLNVLENEVKKLESKMNVIEAERGAMARGGNSREDLQRQNDRLNAAVNAYNEAIERHSQFLESAKKAGVPVTVKK